MKAVKIVILNIFVIILGIKVTISVAKYNGRIIGGQEATVDQFPCAAAIDVQTNDTKFFCGGAIINQNWILISGVCVNNAVRFTIQVGSNSLEGEDSNRNTFITTEYIIHPDFNLETLENDIGLIKLEEPFTYTDFIQPAYFSYFYIREGDDIVSIGWGQTNDSNTDLSNNLRFVTTTALSNLECKSYYGNQITDNMVCAKGNNNEKTCTGDTGSPLLDPYPYPYIVGVASFISGNGCEGTDPSGFTRILPYVNWIKNISYEYIITTS